MKTVPPPPDPAAIRQQQLDAARKLYTAQSYQQAYEAFSAAYQAQKQPSLLVEMCLCQIALGRTDDAEQLIQQFEREQSSPADHEKPALARCKELTRRQRLMILGVQQCDSDRYREGIRNLAEADRIAHAPDLLLNIGLCYIKDRNLADAARTCEQFKQEVVNRTEEQNQILAECERGTALLRDYNRCLDLFQQRTYADALATCQAVQKASLDEEIRSQSLLRIGYSEARLGAFRDALSHCGEYERTRSSRDEESVKLLTDCKALAERGLAPPLPPAPLKPPPAPWYKRWWVWTLAGTAVAGAAVGVGVGLAKPAPAPEHLSITWDALVQRAR